MEDAQRNLQLDCCEMRLCEPVSVVARLPLRVGYLCRYHHVHMCCAVDYFESGSSYERAEYMRAMMSQARNDVQLKSALRLRAGGGTSLSHPFISPFISKQSFYPIAPTSAP